MSKENVDMADYAPETSFFNENVPTTPNDMLSVIHKPITASVPQIINNNDEHKVFDTEV